MDPVFRDLSTDELELVVGGDAQFGSSMCTTPDRIFRIGSMKVFVIKEPCDTL
jgi:hypothetical protein